MAEDDSMATELRQIISSCLNPDFSEDKLLDVTI